MNAIQLIGPGAAGKTTLGRALAERLALPFFDLDQEFIRRIGNISSFINTFGYPAYARQNVIHYLQMTKGASSPAVIALSSGFMTYPKNVHPDYADLLDQIAYGPSTLVLLPSLDFETCVAETVRRQMQRPFARSPEREEEVIRARFLPYAELPAKKIETLEPIEKLLESALNLLDDKFTENQIRKSHG
ncbi:hypothetical protein GCM10007205_27600 [Oxalicibacterium flavum]|uniref:Shikimate kinase n=1 Tax=Oxalicibacterium flavum TaxID=179467 RepID=A0A8J2UNZ3_9BURK|nr:shikimate kinase [Oxalicibacterium flavum]GGC17098.1 hypothetical protein GCM10007205_27600 [Oxalicibacterium flavum]